MELGIFTFGDDNPDPLTGTKLAPAVRMANLVEEATTTEAVGLDVFGLGEHHREDYISSAPAVILGAVAARTERIRLTSAVTVLSSDDPVRVYQDFATLDLLSNGRAEIMAGRGSFIESFPLFGYNLEDYDELFTEKLELLLQLRSQERVTWSGKHRAAINDRPVYPRPVQNPLPVTVAVGGTPESVFRAGALGLPLAIAILGGNPERFAPLVRLYHHAADVSGQDIAKLHLSINAHAHIADTFDQAVEEAFPYHSAVMNRIGRERGWPPMTLDDFAASAGPDGPLVLGDPDQVAAKILRQHEYFAQDRYMLQIGVGTMPHQQVLRAIELYGTRVAPIVHGELSSKR